MKTCSSAKKRFKISGTGKVMFAKAGRRHGMSKRPQSMLRDSRGTHAMTRADAANVKKYLMPNG